MEEKRKTVGSGSGTARLIKFIAWMTQPARGLGVGSELTRPCLIFRVDSLGYLL